MIIDSGALGRSLLLSDVSVAKAQNAGIGLLQRAERRVRRRLDHGQIRPHIFMA